MSLTRNLFTLIAAIAVGAFASLGQAATFTDADISDSEFSTAGNWNDNLAPVAGGTYDINGPFTVERTIDSDGGRVFVRGGGVLNINGGTHNDSQSGASIYNFIGSGSAGTVNQTAGLNQIGHSLRIGDTNVGNVNNDGAYNLMGGQLVIYRGSNSAIDPSNPGGRPSMEIGGNGIADSALFEISGGSFETRAGVHVGDAGVFSVVGSDATSIGIGSNQSVDGLWLQAAGGILSAQIDAGGITPIFIDDVSSGVIFAEFRAGSILDLGFDGIAPVDGTWTIMEVENTPITDLGLGLAAGVDSNWSFAIDNSGTNGLLTATYTTVAIPEPSTLIMVGLASIAMLRRRS